MGIDETQSYCSHWLSPNIFLYDTSWICDSAIIISFTQYFLPGWHNCGYKPKRKMQLCYEKEPVEGLPIELLKSIVLQSFPQDDYLYYIHQWLSVIHNPPGPTLAIFAQQATSLRFARRWSQPWKAMLNLITMSMLIMNFWWHPGSTTYGSTPVYTTYSSTSTSATSMDSPSESYKKQNGLDYPVNVARWGKHFHLLIVNASLFPSQPLFFTRNVARQTVSTHFVFPSDIELYPR